MKIFPIPSTLLSLAIAISCFATEDKQQPTIEADMQAIKEARFAMDEAFKAGEIDAFDTYYTDDIVLLPPNRPIMVGKDVAIEWLNNFYAQRTGKENMEYTTTFEEIVVTDDWAFSRNGWIWKLTPEEGETVEQLSKGITIWHRDSDGTWQTSRMAWNSDKPPSSD